MQYIIFYMANIFLKDPFKHQMDAVVACHNTDMDKFAYLMEMGTGKTLTALVDLFLLNQRDMVDYAVVLAPKSVYRNWMKEINTFISSDYDYKVNTWDPSLKDPYTKEHLGTDIFFLNALKYKLHIFLMNIEALSTPKGTKYLGHMMGRRSGEKTMMIVDESTTIKTHNAKRTKTLLKLSENIGYKGGNMANIIDFDDLKKDSGDLKNLQDSELQKLSSNIQKQLDYDIQIEELEETLKELKRERAILSEDTIPQQMQELGISDTTMADGSRVTIKEGFHCRIPKDKIEEAHTYLRENELGDIIKNQVVTSFGTGEDNMAGDLAGHIQDQYGITPDVKESVHPSTLKATLKKRHEEGLSDPDDLFGIFIRPETKITKGKKQ